jgi:hypothetical protein
MMQLKLLDKDGNAVEPQDLQSLADLTEAADRARALLRECERLARLKAPKKAGTGVPYA